MASEPVRLARLRRSTDRDNNIEHWLTERDTMAYLDSLGEPDPALILTMDEDREIPVDEDEERGWDCG